MFKHHMLFQTENLNLQIYTSKQAFNESLDFCDRS